MHVAVNQSYKLALTWGRRKKEEILQTERTVFPELHTKTQPVPEVT